MSEQYDRRKEDRFLAELERRIGQIESILRFDVIKPSGERWKAMDRRLSAVETNVRMINQQAATKNEIQRALNQQTKELKKEKANSFSKREKIIGLGFAGALVALELLQIVFK